MKRLATDLADLVLFGSFVTLGLAIGLAERAVDYAKGYRR